MKVLQFVKREVKAEKVMAAVLATATRTADNYSFSNHTA